MYISAHSAVRREQRIENPSGLVPIRRRQPNLGSYQGALRSIRSGTYAHALRSYGLGDASPTFGSGKVAAPSFWSDPMAYLNTTGDLVWDATVGWWVPRGVAAGVASAAAAVGVPQQAGAPGASAIIGSSASDVALNAATGAPTDAQIAANTNACIQANANMRAQGYTVPASADQQCVADQKAYVNLIGGTAQDILKNVIMPNTPGKIALYLLLGVVGVGAAFVYLK